MFSGPEVLWARRAFLLLISFSTRNPGDSFQGFKLIHKKVTREKDSTGWGSAFIGLETIFPLPPISQGFLGPCYYSERFESIVPVVRLLSKLLDFLAQSQSKRSSKQTRPFNLPGSPRAPLALQGQGEEWGGEGYP